MKSIYTLPIVFLFLLTTGLNAQIALGFKAGYINAWEDYGDVFLPEDAQIHVNGFHFAAVADYKLNKRFSIGAEPGFAQKGAACYPGNFFFAFDTKFQLHYIEMPIMLSARLPVGQKDFEVFGKVGYGVSYLVSAYRGSREFGSDDSFDMEKENIEELGILERWDSGLYAGLGISQRVGNINLFLESKYYRAGGDAFTFADSKNRSIYVGLGCMTRVRERIKT